jgi:hypothetical protein
VILIERVSSARPVSGRSEQGNEAFDLLASLREIDSAVSYGVFLCVSEPIHRVQASNCFDVPRAFAGEAGSKGPCRRNGAPELCKRALLLRLIGRGKPRRFNGFNQLESAGRTARARRDDNRIPDLQADLDGADSSKCGDECREQANPQRPTKLSDSIWRGARWLFLHGPLSAQMIRGTSNVEVRARVET